MNLSLSLLSRLKEVRGVTFREVRSVSRKMIVGYVDKRLNHNRSWTASAVHIFIFGADALQKMHEKVRGGLRGFVCAILTKMLCKKRGEKSRRSRESIKSKKKHKNTVPTTPIPFNHNDMLLCCWADSAFFSVFLFIFHDEVGGRIGYKKIVGLKKETKTIHTPIVYLQNIK